MLRRLAASAHSHRKQRGSGKRLKDSLASNRARRAVGFYPYTRNKGFANPLSLSFSLASLLRRFQETARATAIQGCVSLRFLRELLEDTRRRQRHVSRGGETSRRLFDELRPRIFMALASTVLRSLRISVSANTILALISEKLEESRNLSFE